MNEYLYIPTYVVSINKRSRDKRSRMGRRMAVLPSDRMDSFSQRRRCLLLGAIAMGSRALASHALHFPT